MFLKSKLILICSLLTVSFFTHAQSRDRIYIQTDRTAYVAGEPVWFKAYLLSALTPGSSGTNLLVDMVDEKGSRISSGSLPIIGATASGNFDLPLSLAEGVYFLRAYTKTQPSKNEYSSAVKIVYVFNPSNKSATTVAGDYQAFFRPSSGNLVVGAVNIVYVEVRDRSGKPAVTEGTLVNAKEEVSVSFKTDAGGKTKFAISPIQGEQYTAKIRYADGTTKNIELPRPAENKVLISVTDQPKAKLFNVFIPELLRNRAAMSVKGYMDENLVFQKNFTASTDQISARIPVDELPTGLLQLIVTDIQKQKLGETVSLIVSDSSTLTVSLQADTISLKPQGQNVVSLTMPDGVIGSFSVSVTDADKTIYTQENNIITGLLLNQDSRHHSFVNNTVISSNSDKETLETAIGSADWLDQSVHAGETVVSGDSGFITIKGTVINKGNKKPITKGDLNFIYSTHDSIPNMLSSPIGKEGAFILPELMFEGRQLFRYSLNGDKWTEPGINVDTSKQEDLFPLPFQKEGMQIDRSLFGEEEKIKQVKESYTSLTADSISSTGLKDVVVRSRVVAPKQQVNDRYTKGLFNSMGSAKTLDLINEPPNPGGNILDYLQGQVPGLLISIGMNGEYSIQSSRVLSLTMMPPVRLFLNEQPVTIDYYKGIRATDVALVKFYPPGMGGALPNVGIGAALVIYTKKPTDVKDSEIGAMSQFYYYGYMASKDFSVDYLQKNASAVSKRNTIYWNPNLLAEEGQPSLYKIRFKNSETAKRMKIVVEGFTLDGRLLHYEKMIE